MQRRPPKNLPPRVAWSDAEGQANLHFPPENAVAGQARDQAETEQGGRRQRSLSRPISVQHGHLGPPAHAPDDGLDRPSRCECPYGKRAGTLPILLLRSDSREHRPAPESDATEIIQF